MQTLAQPVAGLHLGSVVSCISESHELAQSGPGESLRAPGMEESSVDCPGARACCYFSLAPQDGRAHHHVNSHPGIGLLEVLKIFC